MGIYRRPFDSVAAMDAALVDRWNAVVTPQDDIWHLGDFAIKQPAARVAELLSTLNGNKHLVTGNNDPATTLADPHWQSVQPYAEMTLDDRLVVMCHYPFRTWRDMASGAVNLHGHSHGRLQGLTRQFDVGVDVWDFRPMTLADIMARPRRKSNGDVLLATDSD